MSGYWGHLTGKTYESVEAMRHYEGLEAQRRCVPTAEESAFDNLPAEKIREHFDRLVAGGRIRVAQEQTVIDLEVFKQLHPEFQPSQLSRAAMLLALRAIGANVELDIATLEQLEEAFELCKANGSVELQEGVLRGQAREQIRAQADRIRQQREMQANFNESRAYEMSPEELRQHANDQLSGVVRHGGVGSMRAEFGETTRPLNSAVPDALDDPQRHVTPGSSVNRRGFAESNRL